MRQIKHFTVIIEREGDGYVSLCPQLDIASQGKTIEEARNNLVEALELFFEVADPSEIRDRHKKLKALAWEILNDWSAVVAFVFNPDLPVTNNDAERVLRHAVLRYPSLRTWNRKNSLHID
jgi:predicted RNase H-like HicB family nuclease